MTSGRQNLRNFRDVKGRSWVQTGVAEERGFDVEKKYLVKLEMVERVERD
jgi:hypothetical protein